MIKIIITLAIILAASVASAEDMATGPGMLADEYAECAAYHNYMHYYYHGLHEIGGAQHDSELASSHKEMFFSAKFMASRWAEIGGKDNEDASVSAQKRVKFYHGAMRKEIIKNNFDFFTLKSNYESKCFLLMKETL